MDHPLDDVVWTALTGRQASLALCRGFAVRQRPAVGPFAALAADTPAAWADLAALGGTVVLTGARRTPPPGWTVTEVVPGVQLEGAGLAVAADPDAVVLGRADVPEMLDLAARTRPGPFREGTIATGTYLGLREGSGALVAMGGERFRVPGWTEISAVCTDPAHRGRGLAARLVRAVGALVRARGEVPFLHTAADNATAVRLYTRLGFTLRAATAFTLYRPPAP